MKRIVAFGDSYTYGHGLSDCYTADNHGYGPTCSKYAWPALLSTLTKTHVVNRSEPGFSNLAILHRLFNTVLDNNDIVIIMWSFPHRDMIFNKTYLPRIQITDKVIDHTHRTTSVGSWMEDELTKSWMLAHNNTDLVMRSWLHIHHANLYLSSLNIPHYNFFVDYSDYRSHKPIYVHIPFTDIGVQHYLDKACDGNHPGPLTQERMAENIKKAIEILL